MPITEDGKQASEPPEEEPLKLASEGIRVDGDGRSKKNPRRRFIKTILLLGAFAAFGGYFLSKYIPALQTGPLAYPRQIVRVDDLSRFGTAAGMPVKISDLTTFPPNSNWVITYPSTGDPKADAALPDTFRKFELIRLPVELGGDKLEASSFVAFSKVCVHLECSPNYNPSQNVNPSENGYEVRPGYSGHQNFECPCHGSIYRLPDGLSVEGPASLQPPPSNAVPMLTLSVDGQNYLWVEPPVWDVYHNGKLGYGRYVQNQ
jgi:Rieske Fe-S protein